MSIHCRCTETNHVSSLIVLTGGPGAGKTAILEIAKKTLCKHIVVLPEAASILFGGGFLRRETHSGKRSAQRAIYHVQKELECIVEEEAKASIVLCDRGALDGLAYWPGAEDDFFSELQTTQNLELSRYKVVIHLRTPTMENGYNHNNPVRTETAAQAAAIDLRIEKVWNQHPSRFFIEGTHDFLKKAHQTIELIRAELPECCR